MVWRINYGHIKVCDAITHNGANLAEPPFFLEWTWINNWSYTYIKLYITSDNMHQLPIKKTFVDEVTSCGILVKLPLTGRPHDLSRDNMVEWQVYAVRSKLAIWWILYLHMLSITSGLRVSCCSCYVWKSLTVTTHDSITTWKGFPFSWPFPMYSSHRGPGNGNFDNFWCWSKEAAK